MSLPWPQAERAIALDPNNADSYMALASVLNIFGERTTEAIELVEKAIRLNPRYPFEFPFQSRLGLQLGGALRGGDRCPETSPSAQPQLAVFLYSAVFQLSAAVVLATESGPSDSGPGA